MRVVKCGVGQSPTFLVFLSEDAMKVRILQNDVL